MGSDMTELLKLSLFFEFAPLGFPGGSVVKNPLANAGDVGSIPEQEDPLEEEMATYSRSLAWEIPWGCKELDLN